jgi:hypothetical protein
MTKSVDAGNHLGPPRFECVGRRPLSRADQGRKNHANHAGHYVGNGEYVHNDVLKKRSEVVQDLVMVNVRAIDYILKDPKTEIPSDSE